MAGNGIVVLTDPPRIISVGPQGPQGPPGSGSVYVQETAPSPVVEGDLWLQPSTSIMRVRANGIWEEVVYRSQLADETETIEINAGYF